MQFFRKIQMLTGLLLVILLCSNTGYAQKAFTKLVWADEFNITGKPDTAKWSYDIGRGCPQLCGWGNNELQYYTDRTENARIENGKLIIEVLKEKMNDAAYTSSRLVSKNKGDWEYGRFEIMAKIPAGKGMWPAIWMLPTNWEYGGWPKSGEIDIMENVGYWPDSVIGTVHTGAYNGSLGTQKGNGIKKPLASSTVHLYEMEWTPDVVSLYVDRQKYFEFKNDQLANTDTWPFNKKFHLLLNVAVGGNWGGKYGVDDSIFPQRMEIDYIRVYQ